MLILCFNVYAYAYALYALVIPLHFCVLDLFCGSNVARGHL